MRKTALKANDLRKYDFLDFGASAGGSIEFAKARLFGKQGLGVDIDPERVSNMKKAGYDCMVGDLCELEVPEKCVKFVVMSHILEHMPSLEMVQKVIANAQGAARDYLVITGPFFDEDAYLEKKGFKLHWSDYWDHPCHLKVTDLKKILKSLGLNDYELYVRFPIVCSTNIEVHPLNSPSDQKQYNPKIHPPKKHVTFHRDIYTDFVCYVKLREVSNWDKVTKAYKHAIPYTSSPGLIGHAARKLLRKTAPYEN